MKPFEESILNSVKESLGIIPMYEHFDQQILFHLNSVLAILPQIGVGPAEGFIVENDVETWGDLIGEVESPNLYLYVKSYVSLRVRLLFDPPTSSGAIEAMERQMRELEWRITVTIDPEPDEVVRSKCEKEFRKEVNSGIYE